NQPVPAARRRFALLCATVVLLLGFSVLIRYAAGWEAGLDQLLFRDKLAAAGTAYRNRMAPNTALMFMLVGLSLLALDHGSRAVQRCAELLCLATGLLAFLALTGYLYGASFLYGVASYIPIAPNTALAFALLTIAILAARPGRGLTALARSRSPGGVLIRRVLPAIMSIPLLLGLLRLEGQQQGLYDTAGGVAMSVTFATVLLASLVWWSAASLDRADAARKCAEQAVRNANEELEGRVVERTEELRGQKDFLRKVVDTNPQLVFIKDWDGRFVLANRAVADLYGTTAGELEGKSDADFNSNAAELESFLRADREVMQSGRALSVSEEAVTDGRTGAIRWFQTIKVPLTAPDGMGKQVLGVATDITERRRAGEQLRRTADELEALVQASPLAIVGIDMEGKVLSWYGVAETIFGWTADEVIGRPLANVPPEKQEEFRALRTRVLHGDSIVGLETSRIRKDGSRIDVSISYAPLHDRRGHTVGATIVYQDITERRLVAEQRQAREAAEAASRAKSNFLANMSHELRTPLNAIIGFSELLEDQTFGPLNEKQQRYVHNVHSSGRHLLQLVNDILDLAKIEAGRLVLEPESINLNALLHDMQRGLEPLAVAKRQTFVLEVPQELPTLIADRGKVKQILYNLLSNAIKFTKDGGRIGVRAMPVRGDDGGDQVQVAVWDSGVGMAEEDLHRIFLEFEQVDSSYVRQQEGTGLGLALTRRLVEAHRGKIWVESKPGEGSTFTFVLPTVLHATNIEPLRPTSVRNVEQGGEGPLVLVVEDDTTARELLTHYLVEHGYRVHHAGSAAEALDMARKHQPAAISLDIFLPDEHGLELLSKLRADPVTKDIPVVVVSITDDRELGFNAGAAAWLVKPVQRQQFIEALDRLAPLTAANGRRVALVVDDDREAVELAGDVLRGRGFEVLQAFGGTEGLALAIHHMPALIILDLNMPGLSGFTVAQQLRAHPRTRQIPILVSTAMDLSGQQREELMRHVQTVLLKGGAEGLLEALERLGLTPARSGSGGSVAPTGST
ncbi:MAG: response regulator, partial [Gemmatimonadales bacterium]